MKSIKMSSRKGNVLSAIDWIDGLSMNFYVRKNYPELYEKYKEMPIQEWVCVFRNLPKALPVKVEKVS